MDRSRANDSIQFSTRVDSEDETNQHCVHVGCRSWGKVMLQGAGRQSSQSASAVL